ncbi:MAG: hypothetical protein IKF90_15900, partial [Parasporobacterium sp.]|nr:hypothetical protein [Parasporobacterium sp.]
GQADAESTDIAVDDAAEAKTEAAAEEAPDAAVDVDDALDNQNKENKDAAQSSGTAETAEEASNKEEENKDTEYKSGTLTATGDSYKVTLDYTAEAKIPEEARLQVTEITAESDPEAHEACLEEARKQVVADDNVKATVDAAATRFFDIEIIVEEEGQQKKIEPSAPVAVNIQLAEKKDTDKEEDSKGRENTGEDNKGKSNSDAASAAKSTDSTQDPTVLHFTEEGVEHIEAETSVNETKKDVATEIQFETESFSIYGVVYTVDFHWEVNGQTYEYRLDGGDTVSFRELLRALHILDEEDDVDKFLAEIETIQFSDESLVKVVQITEGITAGALKQKWDLEPEYAANLTEPQIAKINEKVFYAPDWALVSMKAFDTEEYLTVTMQTGEQFRIQVTDAQLTKKVISASGKTYEITVTYDDSAEIPDGAELTAEEILPEDENYVEYFGKAVDALKGIEKGETASQSEITGDTYARFFDISIMDGGEKVEPKAAVKVDIQLADAVETDDAWSVVHFEADRSVIMESETVLSDKTDAVEMVFETDGFSVYGVITVPSAQPDPAINDLEGRSFTISHDSRYVTTNITPIENGNNTYGFGKTTSSAQAATWYFERPSGSSGNTYYIYTLNGNNEKQYINLTRNNSNTDRANASLSANPQPFTVTRDGNTYRLAAQTNGTTYYLDEHNGDRGNAFAGWHGATDNGRLTLNFPSQPVMQNDGKYMALVKYEGKYYIVNNDCSLTEVEYDEATHTVAVDDPMLWTINKNNPNGHIYFNSKEAGFTELLTASDWYRRYLDPSSARGYLEETNEPGAGHVDIDTGTWHYSQEADKWYMEHQITNRRNVENNTTVSIDNTSTGDSTLYNIYHGNKNGSNYLGVVVNADGTLRLAGQQS